MDKIYVGGIAGDGNTVVKPRARDIGKVGNIVSIIIAEADVEIVCDKFVITKDGTWRHMGQAKSSDDKWILAGLCACTGVNYVAVGNAAKSVMQAKGMKCLVDGSIGESMGQLVVELWTADRWNTLAGDQINEYEISKSNSGFVLAISELGL